MSNVNSTIFCLQKEKMFKINTIDKLLHAFYEEMDSIVKNKFYKYIVKISQVNSSFYVLIRKRRGKILGDDLCRMMKQIKDISEKIYSKFSKKSKEFHYSFFLYFKLVRTYGNYQYHFLVVRQDYF